MIQIDFIQLKIELSYPREYDNDFNDIENHPLSENKGIYFITKKWAGANESPIYIGKTTREFKQQD